MKFYSKLSIKRSVLYSIVAAILTGIFVSIILIGERFFRGVIGYSSIWIAIIVVFVFAFIFQPGRELVQKLFDRIFSHTLYNYQTILRKYSRALNQPMTDLNRFARLAPYLLIKAMKLSSASVLIFDRETHAYILRAGEGQAQELESLSFTEDSVLLAELVRRRREITIDEIEEKIKLEPAESGKYEKIKAEMDRLKTVLIIPSISESEYFKKPTLLATINLGKKLSGRSYSQEDIDFLNTLANQATISIECAFIFEELRKNQERILQSERLAAIGTTTAGVAHELKNPLTYLSAVAQVLHKKWDDPKFRESVGQMLPSEVQRMQLIIEGLLHYSRSQEPVFRPLDVTEIIEKTMALLSYDIKKNKIFVRKVFRHTEKAKADPNRLMQVLVNVVGNAIQAMTEKGGDLMIITRNNGNKIEIAVQDSGVGVPQSLLNKIYNPFFTTKESGSGLGLMIVKKIIDEHQGNISVQSREGKGSTFTISLPQVL